MTKNDPLYSLLKLYLAQAHSRSGNCPAAIEDIKKVIAGFKGSVFELNCLSILAFCYVETKSYSKAVTKYKEMLKIEKSEEVKVLLEEAEIISKEEKKERASSDSKTENERKQAKAELNTGSKLKSKTSTSVSVK